MILARDDRGTGPVVVLLHGFPLDRTMWSEQVEALAQSYRVITPDLRGIGESKFVNGRYVMSAHAGDVIETLDSLKINEPVILGGLSMGGYIAFAVLENYPARVRGLMLLDTRAIADTPAVAEGREKLAQQLEETKNVEPVVASMIPKLFAPDSFINQTELVDRVRARALTSNPQSLANTLRGLATRVDRTEFLRSISIATLVLTGSDDQIVPRSETEALAAAIPNARLVIVPHAGHLAPLENPRETNLALLDFLSTMND